ncbi:TIGR02922 family protein [Shewanella intestini]|uniref:TIGR02922 family protein n=1 Tax=Shewanella intestini TaxID=2017544 RepID=A0ABS5I347_9GAMM|nr:MULTISPECIES: TIGR02922 family protein [Shewanella]MBR9728458.1 TIGR02922 family protein [Shewanella intestini]MRG36277.1 TIGR02922 family protein [Shewanella sp. XMDDZSB0408]
MNPGKQQVLSSTNDTGFATVTVLFYDAPVGLEMHNAVLRGLKISDSGRVMIPDDFRDGKSIIAVLDGECRILNSLGERVYSQKLVAE